MTQDKARKRATRDRVGGTRDRRGDTSYAEAARTDPMRTPQQVADVAPAAIISPVSVQMCRHLHAAGLHLGAWRRLAEDHQVVPERFSRALWEDPSGPAAALELAHRDASRNVIDLKLWSERTAHASGASAVPNPSLLGGDDDAHARHELYPVTATDKDAHGWCAAAGGRMPLPGETHQFNPEDGPGRVRYSLPGRVPDTTLTAYSRGQSVRPARDVVPGTPAAPIWGAHELLYSYASGWMDRRGDSPADLAAAVDGLMEVSSALADVASQLTREVQRRVDAGGLSGVDGHALIGATAELTDMLNQPVEEIGATQNHLYGAFFGLRDALRGAEPTLPPSQPGSEPIPEQFTQRFNGWSVTELRSALGEDRFVQRQMSKTVGGNYSRADMLERMIQWMHAAGMTTYNAQLHAAAETQAASR